MVDDAAKDAIAALLRKRDYLRKNGADAAKLAEMNEQLRLAGHDPDAESKKPARSAVKADGAKAPDDDSGDAKSDSKASGAKAEPKTSAASANVPSGRTAPSKAKAA